MEIVFNQFFSYLYSLGTGIKFQNATTERICIYNLELEE